MAGQRGFGGRSREDLYAAAESVSEMLAQLKGPGGRGRWQGNRRGAAPPHEPRWKPDLYPHQEREEGPRNPQGPWRRDWSRGRPGPDERFEDQYSPWRPPGQEWRRPRAPEEGPHWRQRNREGLKGQPPRRPGDPVTAQQLVQVLSENSSFSVSLLNLLEQHNFPPNKVRGVVARYGHLFHIQDEMVTLSLRLKLCIAYSSPNGCQSRETCDSLHMCPKYVLSWCDEKEACVLGHRLHTDHNLAILKRLSMEFVHYPVLRRLLRRGYGEGQDEGKGLEDRRGRGEAGPLGVCRDYNEAGCEQVHCPSLHVCLSFVVGLTTCTRKNCRLNHDLLSPACCSLLKLHNLPVNESPRDVAMALLQANPRLKDTAGAGPTVKSHPSKDAEQGRARKGDKSRDSPDSRRQRSSKKNRTPAKEKRKESSPLTTETKTEDDSEESDDSSDKGNKSRGRKMSNAAKGKQERRDRRDQGRSSSESTATETDSEKDDDDLQDKSGGRNKPGKEPSKKESNDKEKPKNKEPPKPKDDGSQGSRQQEAPKPPPRRTLWAHYLYGDVATPQICYYSVETMCRDEANGCPRLHALTHFHWQVREQDGRWCNLRPEQATCIERAFCDPALDGVDLPRLDPSKLEPSVSGLFLLLGRDVWHADFLTNSLTNSTLSKKLQLRRLCTEPVAGQTIKAATHHWYFLDINKKWVKYGNVDTAGKTDLVSSITSADIERHYLQNPAQPLTFQNAKFSYVLDLIAKKQTNQSTQVSREIRRRPEPHLQEEKAKDTAKAESDLPPHWDAMQPEERSRLVALGPTSDEYKKVVGLFGTIVSTNNIVKVERIQNPFMWRALQNKIKEMAVVYKGEAKVDVRQLFHGTSHNVVASICAENFDWRLHGTSTGQAYGRGTYFGTNAGTSYKYCRPDPNGIKYMFVARVALGSVTTGNASMARPPMNPATSMPYDSTVDNPANPALVVKYSTQEYYPEYLLTLT